MLSLSLADVAVAVADADAGAFPFPFLSLQLPFIIYALTTDSQYEGSLLVSRNVLQC